MIGYDKFRQFVIDNLSDFYPTEKGIELITDTTKLQGLIPNDVEPMSEEETIKYLFDNQMFGSVMDVIREQRAFEWKNIQSIKVIQDEADTFNKAIAPYAKGDFRSDQLEQINLGIKKKLDVNLYAKPAFEASVMSAIREAMEYGYDITLLSERFSGYQMMELAKGLVRGLDISYYAAPDFSPEQMEQIRIGLENFVDVSVYAFPNIAPVDMKSKREELMYEGSMAHKTIEKEVSKESAYIEFLDHYNREVDESPVFFGTVVINGRTVEFSESENSGDIFPNSDNFDELEITQDEFHKIVVEAISVHEAAQDEELAM